MLYVLETMHVLSIADRSRRRPLSATRLVSLGMPVSHPTMTGAQGRLVRYRAVWCVLTATIRSDSQYRTPPHTPHYDGSTIIVRPSGRGTVHWRPHEIFLQFHGLSTLLNKIREGVALSPLSILHKTHLYAN